MKIAIKILRITGKTVGGIFAFAILCSIFLYFVTKGDYSVPLTVEFDSNLPSINVAGKKFHAESFGSDTSQTVIVLHGGPGNDYKYMLPLKELEKQYRVVFYDQQGTGLSPRVSAEELSLESSLQDLSNIIDFYSPNRPVRLIGHSWGAMLATAYIAKFPNRVDKVVLAEPGMLTSETAKLFTEKFKFEMSFQLIKASVITLFESFHIKDSKEQDKIDYVFGKISSMDIKGNPMKKYFCNEDVTSGYFPFWRLSGLSSQAIISKAMNENGEVEIDLVSGLENYTKKVLFITGECSQILGESHQKHHIKYFPSAELIVIKNAGHTMFGEKTDESIKVINSYFSE